MSDAYTQSISLSQSEADLVAQIAEREGISIEQAATMVVKASIARRMKKRTGKAPARVFPIAKKI
jgi:hypothetical protein